MVTAPIKGLKPRTMSKVKVVGLVVATRSLLNKRNQRMGFVTLDDGTGKVDLVLFSDVFEKYKDIATKDALVLVEGEVSVDDYTGGIRMSAQRILTMADARQYYAKRIIMNLHKSDVTDNFMDNLMEVLTPYQNGTTPVSIAFDQGDATAEIQLGPKWKIDPTEDCLESLYKFLGEDRVLVEYT